MSIVRTLIAALVAVLPEPRVIKDRAGESPYLSRWYLLGRPHMADGSSPFVDGNPKVDIIWAKGLGLYLHRFHRSDDDTALHNHPWRWAASLILAGGYREERRKVEQTEDRVGRPPGEIEAFDYKPGDVNVLTSETFHRVDLYEGDAWSLFLTGPKFAGWGFWERETGIFTPWREFIARTRAAHARAST